MSSANVPRLETEGRCIRFANDCTSVEIELNPIRISIKNLETSEIVLDKARFGFEYQKEEGSSRVTQPIAWSDDFAIMQQDIAETTLSGTDGAIVARLALEAPKRGLGAALEIELAPALSRVLLRCSLVNRVSAALRMVAIHPLVVDPRTGGRTCFDDTFEDLSVFYNGYQSWSLARVFGLREKQYHAALRIGQYPHHYRFMTFPEWNRRRRGRQVSNNVTVITDPVSKRSITIGFVTALSQHGEIEVTATKKTKCIDALVATSWCEGKKVAPGSEYASEILYIQDRNEYPRCLDEYGSLVASCMKAVSWPSVPFGYCTWYYYFFKIDEQETLKNIEIVTNKEKNPYFHVDYFQLDDGYQFTQGQCGDWKRPNPTKFPGGLKNIVEALNEKDVTPGLWIAPFNALPSSELARAHPDWILKNRHGKPLKPTSISGKFQYALDLTHPEVKAYLQDLFHYFVHVMGFRYMKIDFVFSAITADAVFYNDEVTRVEAYREAVGILREAAGDDVFILGCGAPVLESVGLVNGNRISTDTDPHWTQFGAVFGPLNILISGTKHALLNTITRSWMHKAFYVNDPDCLMVRNTNTKLTEAEIQAELSIIGLSGGQVSVSDDLSILPPERMRLVSLVQPVFPRSASSPDMFVNPLPRLYVLADVSAFHSDWRAVVVMNWADKAQDALLPLDAVGCVDGFRYHVVDFWAREYVGLFSGHDTVTFKKVPRHGCKLLRVTADTPGVLLLGTTMHVVQGAVEITSFGFDEASSILSLGISKQGLTSGSVFVKIPPRMLVDTASGPGFNVRDVAPEIIAIDVDFTDDLSIEMRLAGA
jgi:alpha-galactosidase